MKPSAVVALRSHSEWLYYADSMNQPYLFIVCVGGAKVSTEMWATLATKPALIYLFYATWVELSRMLFSRDML